MSVLLVLSAFGGACSCNDEEEVEPAVITLSRTDIAVSVMEKYLLTATTSGIDGEIVWTSENSEIATVVGGEVTGVSAGDTKIIASYGETSATCTVLVTAGADVPAIEVNEEDVALLVGGEWQISSTVFYLGESYTDATFTYVSDDSSVATVDETGKITGVKVGETTVTVNGSWRSFTDSVYLKAVIKVTVKDNVGIKLSAQTTNLYTYEITAYGADYRKSVKLNYSVTDDGTAVTENVTFSSSNEAVATVSADGTVTALAVGETDITLNYVKNGKTYSSVPLKMTVEFPVVDKTFKSVPFVIDLGSSTFSTDIIYNDKINNVFDFAGDKTVTKIIDENGNEISYDASTGALNISELSYGDHVWEIKNTDFSVKQKVFVAQKVISTAQELANLQTLLGNLKIYNADGEEVSELPMIANKWGTLVADQAAAGRYSYGGYYALGANIDMTGVSPVVKSTHMGSYQRDDAGFYGIFEGAGYTVTGLSAGCGGLFGEVSKDGVVRNLNVKDARLVGASPHNSSVISRNFSGSIENVNISVNLNNNYGGGAICYLFNGGTVKNVNITATGLRVNRENSAFAYWTRGTIIADNINVIYDTNYSLISNDNSSVKKYINVKKLPENVDVSQDDIIWN